MNIVLDTLGSDNPPEELIRGGLMAADAYGVNIVFAGDEAQIKPHLPRGDSRFSIIHAPEVISMEDTPAETVRRKKDSSLVQGLRAVRKKQAQAFVSPANTGAVMAGSLFGLGRIKGIERPGIALAMPTIRDKQVLVIDMGANLDSSAENLFHFGIMGRVYARQVMGVEDPKVALINIGTEDHKGNELVKTARAYLKGLPGFVGNIEPSRLFSGEVDVAVCDGFVGNILLKTAEGTASMIATSLRGAITNSWRAKLGALLLKPSLQELRQKTGRSQFGGAPLLGVKGITIIAHGDSNAEAIKNAIRVAKHGIESDLVARIESNLHEHLPEERAQDDDRDGAEAAPNNSEQAGVAAEPAGGL